MQAVIHQNCKDPWRFLNEGNGKGGTKRGVAVHTFVVCLCEAKDAHRARAWCQHQNATVAEVFATHGLCKRRSSCKNS